MKLPKRKAIRLPEYDYSSPGAYFVTICTHDRQCILSRITAGAREVGALHEAPLRCEDAEREERALHEAPLPYAPIQREAPLPYAPLRAGKSRSLLAMAIGFLKMNSSKRALQKYPGLELWQRSFYEHVIRNENDYREIWEYIDANPAKWVEDRYYAQ